MLQNVYVAKLDIEELQSVQCSLETYLYKPHRIYTFALSGPKYKTSAGEETQNLKTVLRKQKNIPSLSNF